MKLERVPANCTASEAVYSIQMLQDAIWQGILITGRGHLYYKGNITRYETPVVAKYDRGTYRLS
jgi:hypothetical protein